MFTGIKSKIAKLTEAGSLWSYPGYRLFWVSTTIFVLGASAFPIALAVTIIDQGGNATTLGLILGSRILASVIGAPFAGVWTDRLPPATGFFVKGNLLGHGLAPSCSLIIC